MPNDFINVAEETGLIDEIGLWVLARPAARRCRGSSINMHPDFYLAVNVSMRQFKGGFGSGQLAAILDQTGFPPQHLQLEITESLLMDDDIRIKETLNDFRRMGVRLAVDDFGTGYSALSYLREFPVTTLKIDQSFVREMATNRSDRRLVEAIVLMAHGLGLVSLPKASKHPAQDTLLGVLGCDLVQGNYSTPIDAERIMEMVDQRAKLSQIRAASEFQVYWSPDSAPRRHRRGIYSTVRYRSDRAFVTAASAPSICSRPRRPIQPMRKLSATVSLPG